MGTIKHEVIYVCSALDNLLRRFTGQRPLSVETDWVTFCDSQATWKDEKIFGAGDASDAADGCQSVTGNKDFIS